MNKTTILLITLFFAVTAFSQKPDFSKDYRPVKAEGALPKALLLHTGQKYEEALETDISKQDKRKIRKSKEEFLLRSNYQLNNFLLGGDLLFGDPLTQYVNDVADVLLADEPELREKLTFFVAKNPSVNAAATHQGYVFINMGMLAQVQNEAQLAYIIGHEIAHYTEKHVLEGHLERTEIQKNKSFKDLRKADKLSLLSTYSKSKEFEADELGLKRILNSDYSTEACFGIFDVMQYSYLPYDEVPFEKSFFESGDYILPDEYFLEELQQIKRDDDYDDSKSSHPNTRNRREKFIDASLDHDSKGKAFIVSEERFNKVRSMARLEMSNIYVINRDYANAVYNAYLNLKDYPDNKYAKLCMGKALYSMAKYRNASRTREVLAPYKKKEGNIQQVYHFLRKINPNELAILAARYLTQLQNEYPEDDAVQLFADDAIKALVTDHDFNLSYFESDPKPEEQEEEEEEEDLENLSKYEKIKRMRKKSQVEEYFRYAFVGFREKGDYFTRRMQYCEENFSKKEEEDLSHLSWKERLERQQAKRVNEKTQAEPGSRRLGIDKIVVVDPFYVSVDFRKSSGQTIKFLKSEQNQVNFYQKIDASANAAGLNYTKVNSKNLTSTSTSTYNHLAFLNSWFSERLEHENLDILVSQSDVSREITSDFNTNYFYYTGVLHGVNKKSFMDKYTAFILCTSIFGAPLSAYYLLRKSQNFIHFNYVFNLNTGAALLVQKNTAEENDSGDLLKAYLYDIFYQVKKPQK